MPLPQKLPDPTSWRFVFVHRVIRHGSALLVSGYDETARSFLSLHHGEAKPTICVRSKNLRDRIRLLGGWEEITDEVGPQTPKTWDEEKGRWKPDPEGFLPWERKPGEKVTPLPVAVEEPEEEEVPLVEQVHPPKDHPRETPSLQAPPPQVAPPSPKKETTPPGGKSEKKPSTRPLP